MILSFLVRKRRGLTSMMLHLLFRSGSDLMSIYRHKVHLAPKQLLFLPLVIYLLFRLMITFALWCSSMFHSYGWWTFPKYDVSLELCTTLGPSYYGRVWGPSLPFFPYTESTAWTFLVARRFWCILGACTTLGPSYYGRAWGASLPFLYGKHW